VLVYAITQADGRLGLDADDRPDGRGDRRSRPVRGWERRVEKPLLRVERLADRAVGGGLFLMVVAAGSIFGLFFLCSLYCRNVLGTARSRAGSRSFRSRSRQGSALTERATSSDATASGCRSPRRS